MDETRVTVFSDIACHLGEGPTYDRASGAVFWFDIIGKRLLERGWDGDATRVHDLPVMASALAVTADGRHVLATEDGLQLRDARSGTLTMLHEIEADRADIRSNDARVHPSGAFWIGTMGKGAERHAGAIWWYRGGALRRLFPDVTIPNSICFSPDGSTAYFADTAKNILFRVDCDPATGLPASEPAVFLDHRGREGGIDGSVTDADGTIWNARWGSGALDAYAPDGRHLKRIAIPARQSSCPAFAGPDADRVVVTSAFEGYDEAMRAADPLAGQTFLVEAPFRGRHEPRLVI